MPGTRTAFLILLILLALGCSKGKRNLCNTVRTKASIEMKATEALVTQMSNPQALKEHAELLKATSGELSGLKIEDPNLKNAVGDYVKAMRGLAAGYQKAGTADDGADMVVYRTMLNASRKRIAEVCSKP